MTDTAINLPTKDDIYAALMPIQDPEIRIGIVDLGLIYDAAITDEGEATITMTLTTPACPYGEQLIAETKKAVDKLPGVTDTKVNVVWEPPWDPREMASDYAKDQLGIW